MNKDTRTIMQLLGVDEQTALKIQNKMGENGLDFSECDQGNSITLPAQPTVRFSNPTNTEC